VRRVPLAPGLEVSELALGTFYFTDPVESARIYAAYREAGGDLVDTGNVYGSETLVGQLVAHERDRVTLCTKAGWSTDPADPNAGGASRRSLLRAVDDSLRRLATDHIDLLWLHSWDGLTSAQEIVRALDDLVRAGKVRRVGASGCPAWLVARAVTLACERGLTSFAALEVEYGLGRRAVEADLLPMARSLGLGVLAWGALGGGLLAGSTPAPGALVEVSRSHVSPDEVASAARAAGLTPAATLFRWVLERGVIPVVSARTEEELRAALVAAG
jgi:aryl-alcohol dehydrogenase-like predicted oxidoreductase